MKKLLINAARKLMYAVMPLENKIVFESIPDLSDNTRAVFDEMVRRDLNRKYKFVWLLHKRHENLPEIENVSYADKNSKTAMFHMRTGKCLISCNDFMPTRRKGQLSFYLAHGTTIKSVKEYYRFPDDIDYCIVPSEDIISLYKEEFISDENKIVPLGYARNDALALAERNLHELFSDVPFEKIIVWYPTYRQSKNGAITSKGNSLPIIHDEEKAEILNEFAKQNNVLLVLKPHFAQEVSYIKKLDLSHIRFIDDGFFERNAVSSYEFVGSCDALITDYSSIYYDYTLCDKPIALIWEDYEEYKITPGIAKGAEKYLSGGEKIYTLEELKGFVERVSRGVDILQNERNRICDAVNISRDGNNAKRNVDFITEKANL